MLGHEDDEIGDRLDEWHGRVHPDVFARPMGAAELEPVIAAWDASGTVPARLLSN